jgi:hypothetical protein
MTFGNNDCKYHNNSPKESEREEFYSYIYNLWFENHPANRPYAAAAKDTFMNGGYYRADVSDKITILSLNTLPYNTDAIPELIG